MNYSVQRYRDLFVLVDGAERCQTCRMNVLSGAV